MTIPIFTPPGVVEFPIGRAPKWRTFHQEAVSGKDNPIAAWSYPKWQYTLVFSLLRSQEAYQEFQSLAAFYNLMSGSVGVFQYNDPLDNSVTEQTFAIGDGTTTTFQLLRTMVGNGGNYAEPVFAPTGTIKVFVDGTQTGVTVNPGGTVTFPGPPGLDTLLTWTGTFNWLCRFDDDSIDLSQFMSGWWELAKLQFTTVKL